MKSNNLFVEFEENFINDFGKSIVIPDPNVYIGIGVAIGKGSKIFRNAVINHNVYIGKNVIIGNFSLIRNNVILQDNVKIGACNTIEPFAQLGFNSTTQSHCMLSEYGIIGNQCFLGPHFNSMGDNTIGKPKGKYNANPPIIGDNCRFGSATKIVPGIKIADGTVTGAMTLLTKDTEPNTPYFGIPGRKIKKGDQ